MTHLNPQKAFTLIELLIVIGILAVLATTVLLVINPAQMVKQSRDANRITEINQINKALLLFQSFGGSSTNMGTHGTVYVSVPSDQADCSDLSLPALGGGYVYACKPSTTYRNIDGTGWIPVDLTTIQAQAGNLFSSLPIDPINTVANDYYYTYIPGSWALSATMESDKYIASNAANDGGQSTTRFEMGNNLTLNTNLDFCPASVSYGGKTYNTVAIGTQCWFQTNLDYDNGCSSITWVNSTDVGWCGYYTGGPYANEGLLYQWSAAMNGSTTAGAQGLCPTGWHIPTDAQLKTLEMYLGMTQEQADANFSRGTTEGDELLTSGLCGGRTPCGTSGFNALKAGYRNESGSFSSRGTYSVFWSSTQYDGATSWYRVLGVSLGTIYRHYPSKSQGLSIRCLKD